MAKSLSKYELEWWSNRVTNSYKWFKDRVISSCDVNKEEIAELTKQKNKQIGKIIRGLVSENIDKIPERNEYSNRLGDDNNHSSVSHDYYSSSDKDLITFHLYVGDFGNVLSDYDAKIDELRKEKCHAIREICEPKQIERDNYLVIIHSKPDVSQLAEIDKWIKDTDSEYKDTEVCYV